MQTIKAFLTGAFARGLAGGLLAITLSGAGYWVYLQYQDFRAMRAWVIQQILQQKAQAQPAASDGSSR